MVWLWDVHGPDCAGRGVTDDVARARQAAEACIANGQATTTRVELAHLVTGFASLTPGYQRTGEGWRAQHHAGQTTWTALISSEVAAS